MSVGEVDLLVGIASDNNESTMGEALQSVEDSLHQNFVRERAAILNLDGGYADQTRQAFMQSGERRDSGHKGITSLRTIHRISCEYDKSPSQGSALRSIVAAVALFRARSHPIISPATSSLTAFWVSTLLRAIYRE